MIMRGLAVEVNPCECRPRRLKVVRDIVFVVLTISPRPLSTSRTTLPTLCLAMAIRLLTNLPSRVNGRLLGRPIVMFLVDAMIRLVLAICLVVNEPPYVGSFLGTVLTM